MEQRPTGNPRRAKPRSTRLDPVFLIACLLSISLPNEARSHGVLGTRFFPSTLTIEDPFANDELSLLGGFIEEPGEAGEPSARVVGLEVEYAKTILPRVALSIGDEFSFVDPRGGKTKRGTGNLELGVKIQSYTNDSTETVLSTSLGITIGKTGDTDLEADDFSTLSPALLLGQGFGGLPDSAGFLRPLALVGLLELDIPVEAASHVDGERERHSITTGWGFAILYDLHYLQTSVRDMKIRAPFNRIVPLVEVAGETCLHRGCSGDTTGYVSPGLIWIGRKFQLGAEARIPINDRTGDDVGVLLQVHLYLDDLFPDSLGRPLFMSD